MGEAEKLRVLGAADQPHVDELLLRNLDSSLILLSSMDKAGLVDHGRPGQGTYAGCFGVDGKLTAVVAHYNSGNLIVQGDEGLEAAAQLAWDTSGRKLGGILGPRSLVERARAALGMSERPAACDTREILFALALSDLMPPALLSQPGVEWRRPTPAEAGGLLAEWRVQYALETLGAAPTPKLFETSRNLMLAWLEEGNLSLLSVGGEIVSMTGFNASTRGIVQVGNVYTPPPWRGRGYARAAVAGSLLAARATGAVRSTLFTEDFNHAAQRAYQALGYRAVGDYGILLF